MHLPPIPPIPPIPELSTEQRTEFEAHMERSVTLLGIVKHMLRSLEEAGKASPIQSSQVLSAFEDYIYCATMFCCATFGITREYFETLIRTITPEEEEHVQH